MYYNKWLDRREHGLLLDNAYIHKRIYDSIETYANWQGNVGCKPKTGAVFNLEFSPEGKVLIAACEKRSIVLFDAVNAREVTRVCNAHTENVNCCKFLTSHLFATCSDDASVALWDLRNVKHKVRSLNGHLNWVKNIEYSTKDQLLVTSAFDGSIFTWDIRSYTENGLIYQKVYHTSGLMRCRITPNGDKLVICTTGGYIIIVHDLNLATLPKDLCGFRPSIYRLMQMGQQYIPQAAKYDHVFSKQQKRNRVELVSDFPEENDAEVILALQIHPKGNSFLSRNISYDEKTQWSCVHDINEEPNDTSQTVTDYIGRRKRKLVHDDDTEEEESGALTNPNTNARARRAQRAAQAALSSAAGGNNNNRSDRFVPDIWAAEVTLLERATRTQRGGPRQVPNNTVAGYNFVYAISSGVLQAPPWRMQNPTILGQNLRGAAANENLQSETASTPADFADRERRIYQNPEKLMYYVQESTEAGGTIKEPGYSADGRIICSPYENGVRLLAYNNDCSEYPSLNVVGRRKPQQLSVVKHYIEHDDPVYVAKFSPVSPLLVTGSDSGKLVWYHPVL